MKVSELMTRDGATCLATDNLNRAAQIMWEHRCGSVPVVDQSGRVVGMVTDRDVGMAAYTQGRRLDDIAVSLAMSHPVWTCPASATAEEAESLMMAHGVHRLVVVDAEERLMGVLSLDGIARQAAAWDGNGDIDLERVALAFGEISRRTGTSEEARRRWTHLEARLHAAEIRARERHPGGARHLSELAEHARQFRSGLRRPRTGAPVH